MKDEQIESILRDRFEPVRASKIPQPRRASMPRFATATAALAAIAVVAVIYSGLGPTPAQAMEQVNRALKDVGSFRVESDTRLFESQDKTSVVIIRSGGYVVTKVDRDPISVISVTQGRRNTYWPKGSKVAYSRTIGDETADAPRLNEKPFDYVLRTFWHTDPVGTRMFTPIEVEGGKALVRVRFFEEADQPNPEVVRKGSITFDKQTSRPTELEIEDFDTTRKKPLSTTYRFSYDKDKIVSPEHFFPKGTEIVDLDAWAERQRKEWQTKEPLAKGDAFNVVEAFTSNDGWTLLMAGGVFNPASEAVDQAGNKWLVCNTTSGEMMKFGYTGYIVAPLNPTAVSENPVVTLTVNGSPVNVAIPPDSGKPLPEWMPLICPMNRVFRYAFFAESMRAIYYRKEKDVPNELRWQRATLERFKRFPGKLELPAVQRIRELERKP